MAKIEALFTSELMTTESGTYHVVLVAPQQVDGKGVGVAVIEPFTWAWVGLMICEGILQAIGGKIFSAVFGSEGATKQDLKDLLDKFIEVVAAVVRQQIQLDDKRKIEASAASLQSLFKMYLNNKDHSFLTPLVFKADDLVQQAESLSLLAVGSFAVVGSLELAILQEIFLMKKSAGNKRNITEKANELIEAAKKYRPALQQYNNSRFGELYFLPSGGFPGRLNWAYDLDGRGIGWFLSREEAAADRNRRISAEFARLEALILVPLESVVEKWKKIIKMPLAVETQR
jgi:hypothetical protein